MDDPRMELPPPEELGEWLQSVRKRYDITQSRLAERADVSPSQISRLESRRTGASYETLYRIQQALLAIIEEGYDPEGTRRAADALEAKHETYDDQYELVAVSPEDKLETAINRMRELQISQLPVLSETGDSVGRLTESDLLDVERSDDQVQAHMGPPFPELSADTPASIVKELLRTNDAVLITAGESNLEPSSDHEYVGILTRADFAGNGFTESVPEAGVIE